MSLIILNVDEVRRTLSVSDASAFVVNDKNVDIVRFALLTGFADIALDEHSALRVMYQRPEETQVRAKTLTYYDTDGIRNYYDWELLSADLAKSGTLMVALCVLRADTEVEEWHTTPYQIRVLGSIHTDDSDEGDETITPTVAERVAILESMMQRVASGAPIVAGDASEMVDTDRIYVLSTDDMWYYYDGSAWTAGGTYGAVATDTTLTQSGAPADAETVGDEIKSLKNSVSLVFSAGDLSFTRYKAINVDFSAGEYILHVDKIISGDTNQETSLIIFSYGGSGNVSLQCERNTEIQKNVVFEQAVSKIYVYSSIGASASSGKSATWYGLSIHKSISDKTLSIDNHFADAAVTGSKIKKTEDAIGADLVEWVDGYYINTNQEIGNEVPLTLVSSAGYRCAIVDCEEGDVFYLDGLVGGNSARLRIFVDENNVKLTTCANNLRSTTETVTAPEGAAKLVLNDAGMVGVAYKGIPPFYYKDIINRGESDWLNVEFSVYGGGVSHPSFVHGSFAKNANGYTVNTTNNNKCSQDVRNPFSAAAGDTLNIKSGYQYLASKATIYADGTKTSSVTGWTSAQTVVKEDGLYLAVVQREDGTVIHPKDAQEAFYVIHNGGKAESKSGFTLSRNPYRNLAWSVLHDVTSVTHAHCIQQEHFNTLRSKYEHLAISNYHPSVPYYPLETYFEDASGILASPNAEHAYFTDSNTHVHLNSVGSFLMSDTDSKYDGTVIDMIYDTLSTLKMQSGGGVTINHPKWSGLSKDQIIPMIVTGGVIAIEIYNASCEASSNTGYALDIWDAILSEGVQVYGVAVPDHEAQYRPAENRQPFGYNHVLVVNKTEDEILSAYRLGHFYTTLLDDGLTLSNVNLSNTGLYSIEVSEASTFTFTTATRSVAISEASTSADFQTEEGDIYVRAEVVRGNNKLWTNAIML